MSLNKIPIAETFDEKVNFNVHMLIVFLGSGRFCEDLRCEEAKREPLCDYETMWFRLVDLVNTRTDWEADKKMHFLRVCEENVINTASDFKEDRIRKGYFRAKE